MSYAYYPGCSLESTSSGYNESTLAIAKKLGIEMQELEDWNCCGATSYMSVDENLSFAISSRNLALAEQAGKDVVAACSACYTVLRKANDYFNKYAQMRAKINSILAAGGLKYRGTVKIKHLLEVIVCDVGIEKVAAMVQRPLESLKVVPYYGCQIVRPPTDFDDPENPTSLDQLLFAIGVDVVDYPYKTRCCGGALIGTREELALRMVKNLLLAAQAAGAACIVTTCPMCQINLEGYQEKVNRMFNTNFAIPIYYFTQLLGFAIGCDCKELGFDGMFYSFSQILEKCGGAP